MARPDALTRVCRVKRQAVTAAGEFAGYGSVFGVVDAAGDIVMPGAFAGSLKRLAAEGRMPVMLWMHEVSQPVGTWLEILEDAHGLFCRGKLNLETQAGREAYALIRDGALDGLSIGYDIIRAEPNADHGGEKLHELELMEVSFVTFPCCDPARVIEIKRQALRPRPHRLAPEVVRDIAALKQQTAVRLAQLGA